MPRQPSGLTTPRTPAYPDQFSFLLGLSTFPDNGHGASLFLLRPLARMLLGIAVAFLDLLGRAFLGRLLQLLGLLAATTFLLTHGLVSSGKLHNSKTRDLRASTCLLMVTNSGIRLQLTFIRKNAARPISQVKFNGLLKTPGFRISPAHRGNLYPRSGNAALSNASLPPSQPTSGDSSSGSANSHPSIFIPPGSSSGPG